MSKSGGRHMEPFNGQQLTKYLIRRHDARVIQQNGSHLVLVLRTGGEVWSNDKRVTQLLGRKVAAQLGMTYRDFREDIGHPIAEVGRISRKQGQAKSEKPVELKIGKTDALRVIAEMRAALDDVHAYITKGAHGSSFFARITQDLQRAKDALPKRGAA